MNAVSGLRTYLRRRLPRPAYRAMRKTYYGARVVARRNPGRGRVLPDFVVIGAAKSGTTSLYASLIEHPFVVPCSTTNAYFSNTKEVRYFDYNYGRGLDWYRSHFPLQRERNAFAKEHGRPFLTGEASPSYISYGRAAQRVRDLLPQAKLIAVLRNPVDRAYSQFQLSRREGLEDLDSFEEAARQEADRLRPELARMAADPSYASSRFGTWSYLARSRYAEQLEGWLECFSLDQFLFLKAEDLFAEPDRTLDTVYDFLGLPGHALELPHLNQSQYDGMPDDLRDQFNEYFKPYNERLYGLVGIDFGWEQETAQQQ
jgi:Sulfotransferase domain